MKVWFRPLFVTFAIFIQVQSIPNAEYAGGKASSIPMTGHHLHKRGTDDINVTMNSGIGSSEIFDVQMVGIYYWQRIYFVDNLNRNSPYHKTIPVIKSETTNYSDLTENILKAAVDADVKVDMRGVIEIISIVTQSTTVSGIDQLYQNLITYKNETIFTEKITREFSTDPYSFGEMFQMMYKGPGVTHATDTVSNYRIPLDQVFLRCRARHIPMIKEVKVVLTDQIDERPQDLITETLSGNPDINKGFGEKYVWLVPVWTTNMDDAVTKIRAVNHGTLNNIYPVTAATAAGKWPHLEMINDRSDNRRLKRIGLLRSPRSVYIFNDLQKYGWDDCTSDINEDLNSDWIHLCWNVVNV